MREERGHKIKTELLQTSEHVVPSSTPRQHLLLPEQLRAYAYLVDLKFPVEWYFHNLSSLL